MLGPRYVLCLVLGTGVLAAACGRDEEGDGLATAPALASAAGQCRTNTLNAAVRDAFTDNTTRQNVQTFAQEMVQAFGDDLAGRATWFGFQILEAVDTAARSQGGVQAASNLATATFPCMELGSASLPDDVTTELEPTGAYGVRGWPQEDDDPVFAHDETGVVTWIIQPPENSSWQDIAILEERDGITGDTAQLFLVLGRPESGDDFNADGDALLEGSFNWSTLPSATFDNPYVVVGNCDVQGGFLQHLPASDDSAEVVGFVQPDCPDDLPELGLERAPRTLVERLFRAFSPEPAYAVALLKTGSGGGTKPSLSPFGIINPGKVNLGNFSQSPKKSGNVTNKPLTPTPVVNPTSNGGVAFKQTSVLVFIMPTTNNGTPGHVCYNWSYNDDQGEADFPHAIYTKAGGVQLFATSLGTLSAPEPTEQPVPTLDPGLTAVSTQFNVKNDNSVTGVCPVFDGETYFTDILNPAAPKFAFDPADATTFPPNYDVVDFPGD